MNTPEKIIEDLEKLKKHVKKYYVGAYPALFLQLHTPLEIQEILDMKLLDFLYCENGQVKMHSDLFFNDTTFHLDEEERKEMAKYLLQRVPAYNATEEMLEDWLCVNIHGSRLLIQAYRKMLLRSSGELSFKRRYNVAYLHSLYGYLQIAFGKKTVTEVAREYGVSRHYLLQRVFKNHEINYMNFVIEQVANNEEDEYDYLD